MAQEQKQPRKSSEAEETTEEVVETDVAERKEALDGCLLYTSPSPRDS